MECYCIKTKNNHPALWEAGGATDSFGFSFIIADADGFPPKTSFIKDNAKENDKHALIVVREGMHVIQVKKKENDETIQIYQISEFEDKNGNVVANCELLHTYDNNEWFPELPNKFKDAVEAAQQKATTKSCTTPFYVKPATKVQTFVNSHEIKS